MATVGSWKTEATWLIRLGDLLTKHRASRWDPYIQWVRKPAAVLAAAAVTALACGLFLHPRTLILGAGLGAVLAVGAVWPWLSILGLNGELSFGAARVREGASTTARLSVRNRAFWGSWGLAVRDATESVACVASGLAFAPARRTTEASWELAFDRRGVHPQSVPRITCGFPFGLLEASRPLAATNRLIVWPMTFPVGPIPEATGSRDFDGAALLARAGAQGDPIGVRPYRRGDSIRRIHWPQSARHGTLIVCELESRATPEVQIVLDVHPDAHTGDGPQSSLEWAVRIAASFAEDWISQGAEVELVFGGVTIAAVVGSVASRQTMVLDALARLQSDASRTLSEVLAEPACSRRSSGLRVVVATDRSDRVFSDRPLGGPAERFVLLAADAFEGGPVGGVEPPESRPWIWIDDPEDVADRIHRRWKEVDVEC